MTEKPCAIITDVDADPNNHDGFARVRILIDPDVLEQGSYWKHGVFPRQFRLRIDTTGETDD